jgi:uncharacterized protein YbaR (Trm112 family)
MSSRALVGVRQVRLLSCPKCLYEWTPITEKPRVCPKCKYHLSWDNQEEGAPK